MKKIVTLIAAMVLLCANCICAQTTDEPLIVHKQFTINTTPGDAGVFAVNKDGSEQKLGAGSVVLTLDRDIPYQVEIRRDGYQRIQRTYVRGRGQKEDDIQMIADEAYTQSDENQNANTNFTITVNAKIAPADAWKIMAGIVQGYFDDIQTMDAATNYLKTNWTSSLTFNKESSFRRVIRTQVIVSSSNSAPLKYNIKIKSEISKADRDCSPNNKTPVLGRDECFEPIPRILHKYKDMIADIQKRLM